MTSTSEDTTIVQGAPRRVVEDAWVAMNRRYLIGTGVLVAALLLLWAVGRGPTALRSVAGTVPGGAGSVAAPAAGVPATTGPGAAAPAAPPGTTVGGAPAAIAPQAGAGGGPAAGATAAPVGSAPAAGSGPSAAGPGSPAGPSSGGGAAAVGANGAPAASGNGSGSRAADLPTPVPGAPVARLYFEPDQAWPSGEVGPRLAPVLARLKAEPDTRALVSGFHDRRGSAERNAELAQRRARAVRRVLIREGVAADRIVLARPQQTQGSGADREARRVEVTVAR